MLKPFSAKGWFIFLASILVLATFFVPLHHVQAGVISDLFDILTGNIVSASSRNLTPYQNPPSSLPLLGSKQTPPMGVGGPADDGELSISSTQDNALVGSRNPLGTLPSSSKDQISVYTVERGDTLGSIAEIFGVSVNTILWANNIRDPRSVKAGDSLVILPVSGVQYEVKKGDTINSIAKKFKGDAAEILSFNGLAVGEAIPTGITIIIPDGELIPVLTPTGPKPGIPSKYGNLPEYAGYYLRPVLGGHKTRGIHGYNGVDLANACGFPVLASAQGSVIVAREGGWNGGYGRYVVISHPNGTQTLYGHMLKLFVDAGETVTQGYIIGLIGSSGNSTGCHVHFEIRGAKNVF